MRSVCCHAARAPTRLLACWLPPQTLVNHILSNKQGLKLAVIENEFGEVGIDDALVMESKEEVRGCGVARGESTRGRGWRRGSTHVHGAGSRVVGYGPTAPCCLRTSEGL